MGYTYDSTTCRRTNNRELVEEFYSVEFMINGSVEAEQYVIYDISDNGLCLLINEDDSILEKLSVGDTIRVKYYPLDVLGKVKYINTKIRHISGNLKEKYKGHKMVGLSIEP